MTILGKSLSDRTEVTPLHEGTISVSPYSTQGLRIFSWEVTWIQGLYHHTGDNECTLSLHTEERLSGVDGMLTAPLRLLWDPIHLPFTSLKTGTKNVPTFQANDVISQAGKAVSHHRSRIYGCDEELKLLLYLPPSNKAESHQRGKPYLNHGLPVAL